MTPEEFAQWQAWIAAKNMSLVNTPYSYEGRLDENGEPFLIERCQDD